MSKNRKISTLEFEYLSQMAPYLPKTDKDGYKAMRYSFLDAIEGVFGDRWFNLKESTRQAIDYICFLSIERGFTFASPDHIAAKHQIARSTIYEALKLLRDEGILYKANRCSRKQNGLGCSVHFFTLHPSFPHINGYLNLGWKADEKADRKAESPETPTAVRVPEPFDASTFSLASVLPNSTKSDIQPNVAASPSKTIIKYVPKEINELYARIFDFRLRFIWQKITQAWKTIKQSSLERADLITHGANICKRLFQIWKQHEREGKPFSVDAMCAFAYKSAKETFFNALGALHMEDYEYDARTLSEARQDATPIPKQQYNKHSAKKPHMPVVGGEGREATRQAKKEQLQEAISYIPTLESIFLLREPDAILEAVMHNVIVAIKEKYSLLDRNDVSSIEQLYLDYTGQHHLIDGYKERMRQRLIEMANRLKA